jgi:hypothetical protein
VSSIDATVARYVTLHNSTFNSQLHPSQSQSHIATDGQSVSKSWCRAPPGAHDQMFITLWQLRSCFCGAPSLTRGWVCLLYMLLALASAVFLGFENGRGADHIQNTASLLLRYVYRGHVFTEPLLRNRLHNLLFYCCVRYIATAAVHRVTSIRHLELWQEV